MAYTAYITNAGQAAIADAQFNGYKIAITRYLIGDTLITETNPALIRNYTQLPGTVVYNSGNNPTDESLTYTKTNDVGIVISVYLHANIGNFTIGSIGLCLEDGTLFAILKLTQTYSKLKNGGGIVGNVISFPFTFVLTIQSVLNLTLTPQSVASLPIVTTEQDLPTYSVAPYANYYIQNFGDTGLAAVACKTATSWQYTLAANYDAFENWLKLSTAAFDSTAIEGSVVYLNTQTNKWSSLDGEGAEQKVIGIRQGNGVRIDSFYYKLNFFQAGAAYYVDTYPQLGRLTTRISKYYVGTAISNSLLKLDFSYSDTQIEEPEYTFYDAAVNASNQIILTLPDKGTYPDAYRNGLKISFVCPINNILNQQISIQGLPLTKLTKRSFNVISYSANLADSDIRAGTLVEATFLAVDEGFRCNQDVMMAKATSPGIQYLKSNKNAIINGDLNIWQRGTSFTSVADSTYTVDRWLYLKNGTMVHDITKSSDVPTVAEAGRLFTSSLKIDCQTSQASIGAGNYALIEHRIEGYNFLPLAQKAMTLSFWVKATKTGVYSVGLSNSGGNRAYVAEMVVNASNTWEKKTMTIPASPASGTWDYAGGIGLSLKIHLACGTNFHGAPNSWLTSFAGATANQVNACDSTSNDFFLTGVQLEEGDVATPFENRTLADELRLCQRYLQQCGAGFNGFEETANLISLSVKFPVIMRASPSLSLMFSSFTCRYCGPTGVGDVLKSGCSIEPATTTSSYSAWVYIYHSNGGGAVSRQLQSRDSGNFIYASAEL